MAAPGTALAGQPGRRVGYRHPAADQRNRPQAADRQGAGRPVRVCLHPPRRSRAPDPVTVSALAWLERAALPVGQLSAPRVTRAALDTLCVRLDGSPAAANTITRKRAVFHGALGYAVELGLLPANPIDLVHWHTPRAAAGHLRTLPQPCELARPETQLPLPSVSAEGWGDHGVDGMTQPVINIGVPRPAQRFAARLARWATAVASADPAEPDATRSAAAAGSCQPWVSCTELCTGPLGSGRVA